MPTTPLTITGTRKPNTEKLLMSILAAVEQQQALMSAAETDVENIQAENAARTEHVNVIVGSYLASSPFNIFVGDLGTYNSCMISLGDIPADLDSVQYTIKDVNGTANSKPIVIAAFAGTNIEGGTLLTLDEAYEGVTIRPASSTRWVVMP